MNITNLLELYTGEYIKNNKLFLFGFIETKGFTTLILLVLFFFGFLTLLIGILGVYIGYILDEVKKRPVYIIDDNDE